MNAPKTEKEDFTVEQAILLYKTIEALLNQFALENAIKKAKEGIKK